MEPENKNVVTDTPPDEELLNIFNALVQQHEEIILRLTKVEENIEETLRVLDEDFEDDEDEDNSKLMSSGVQIARAIFSVWGALIVSQIMIWIFLILTSSNK